MDQPGAVFLRCLAAERPQPARLPWRPKQEPVPRRQRQRAAVSERLDRRNRAEAALCVGGFPAHLRNISSGEIRVDSLAPT